MDHLLEEDLGLLLALQPSKELLDLPAQGLPVGVTALHEAPQRSQAAQLFGPLVVEPREVHHKLLIDGLELQQHRLEDLRAEALDAVVEAQAGQHLGREGVLGLEGALDPVGTGHLELDDLADAQVPERPKVHEVRDEAGSGLEVVPERERLGRDEPVEDAEWVGRYVCISAGS